MNRYEKYGEYSSEPGSGAESAKTAFAFLVLGAAVGALLSLLLAPRSGPEIRRAVRDAFDDVRRELGQQTSRLRRRTSEIAGQTREKVMPIRKTR